MVEARREADITQTESVSSPDPGPDHVIGVHWVVPHERFDPLVHDARIGRAERCTIRLTGKEVSREHARVEGDGRLWSLHDAGSKNGLWLNGARVQVAVLNMQDTLRIGDWVGVVCALPRRWSEGALFSVLPSGLVLSAATLVEVRGYERIAASELPVVIYGETGTGKDGIAQAIHLESGRAGRLLAVNCATLPEAMADALLFGHLKGAFTSAHDSREGHIRAADKGTLFLDEVADLPPLVQAKLLRVVEERGVRPLGGSNLLPVDFRLVVACQEPLSCLVAQGSFRADLYSRLSGVELTVPPLRQRRQEVMRLMSHFFALERAVAPVLSSRAVESLCVYDWPYNVRELKKLASLLARSDKALLGVEDLPKRFQVASGPTATSFEGSSPNASRRRSAWLGRHVREFEHLQVALEKHGGNLSKAAAEAGVPRHRARRLLAANVERTGATHRE